MEKRAKVLNILYRFRIPIIATIVVATASAFTFTGLNGAAKEVQLSKSELVYGETPEAFGKSMFGDALLQYSLASENNWTYDVPTKSGKYKVRAVSTNGYGATTYSAAKEFSILPKPLEINLNTKELTYGNEISYTNNLNPGDKIDTLKFIFADNYNQKNPFGDKETFDTSVTIDMESLKILDSELNDVTYCYSYPNEEKKLSIKKRTLHLVSSQVEKIYDGQELNNENFYVSLDTSLAQGDEVKLNEKTSITEVGKVDIKNNVTIKNGELDRTAFYNISWDTPQLTITKRKLTITTNNINREYNGKRLSSAANTSEENLLSYNLTNGSLAEGHQFVIESFASENAYKPLQNSPNSIEYKIVDEKGDDVTSTCYDITEQFGNINIRKANANISYTQISEEFNYQEIKGGAIASGLIEGDTLTYQLKEGYTSDSINVIGSLVYAYDFSIVNDELGPVDDCYNVVCESETGSLIIKEKVLNISSCEIHTTYDGVPFSSSISADDNHKLYFETEGLIEGHKAEVTFAHENELFVNGTNDFDVVIKDDEDNDVTNLYEIHKYPGIFETLKRDLTIKFSGNSWVFDNQYHQEENYMGTGEGGSDGLAATDNLVFDGPYPSYKDVGTYDNNRLFHIERSGIDVTSYYNLPSLEQIKGDLKIEQRPLIVKYDEPEDKMYDGEFINVNYEDITVENLPDGLNCDLTINGLGSYLSASKYDISFAGAHIYNPSNPEEDLTNNFKFVYENEEHQPSDSFKLGDFEITKRPITISTYSANKIYDSTELNSEGAAIQNEADKVWISTGDVDLASTDTIQINEMSSITQKGTKVNEISYTINNSYGFDVTSSYEISTDFGNLTIEPADLTIELTNPTNLVYDSNYHTIDVTNTATGLKGLDYIYFNTKSYRDAGTYSLSDCFTTSIFNNDGLDVTSSYNIVNIIGSPMIISKYQMYIQMNDFERDLFNRSIPPIGYVFSVVPSNDTLEVKYADSTEKIKEDIAQGLYPRVSYTIVHALDKKDALSNYDVHLEYGTNTLTTTDITIALNSSEYYESYVYTGEEFTDFGSYNVTDFYRYNTTNLPSSYYYSGIEVVPDRTVKDVGEYTMSLVNKENIKIMYSNPETGEIEDVTSFFNISFGAETTKFYIKKAIIRIDTLSYEVVYDGEYYSLTNSFDFGGFIGDHHLEVSNIPPVKDVGTYYHTINSVSELSVKDGQGNDVTHLYEFNIDDSIYGQNIQTTIKKRAIKFTSPDVSKIFDGKQFSDQYLTNLHAENVKQYMFMHDWNNDGFIDDSTATNMSYEYFDSKTHICQYAYKDRIELRLPVLSPSYHVGEYVNEFEVIYYDKNGTTGSLTSNNYDTQVEFGTLEIKKLTIEYTTNKTSKTYDGTSFTTIDDLVKNINNGNYKGKIVTINLLHLPSAIREYIVAENTGAYAYISFSDEYPFLVGVYSIDATFVIIFNGENLVEMGDIEFVSTNGSGSVTIKKRTLTIGNEEQEIIVTRWNPRASEQLTVNGLIEGDFIMIGSQKYDSDVKNYEIIEDMKTPGTYGPEYLSSYINDSTVRIYRTVDGVDVDVTSCYNIQYNFKNIVVSDI